MGTVTVTGRDELGRIIDVTLTTGADVAPPGPEVVGAGVLEDPGNVWQPDTAVTDGHRIAVTVQGERRVFEVAVGGTTGSQADFNDYISGALAPLQDIQSGAEVHWTYLGIVGELPWDVMPITQGLPDNWEVDPEFGNILVTNRGDVTDYEDMFFLYALDSDNPVPVVEIYSAGDADWYFYDSGTGLRFTDTAHSNSIILNVSMDTVAIRSQANADLLHIDRQTGGISMPSLPTADPTNPGQLWNDGGTLKISAG